MQLWTNWLYLNIHSVKMLDICVYICTCTIICQSFNLLSMSELHHSYFSSWNEAEGEHKHGIHQPMFLEKASIHFQVCARPEAYPSDQNFWTSKQLVSQINWWCFSLLLQCPEGGGSLTRTISPIVTVPWDPGMAAPQPPEPGNQGMFIRWQPQTPGHHMHARAPLQEVIALQSAAENMKLVSA